MTTKDLIHKQYFPNLEDPVDRFLALRRASATKRFHTWPTITSQRIDTHSYGAVIIALYLDPTISGKMIKAILFHDTPEYHIGDMPAPTKRFSDQLANELALLEMHVENYLGIHYDLSDYEKWILKMADNLEGMCFALEERMLGNRNMDLVFRNYACFVNDSIGGIKWDAAEKARVLAVRLTLAYLKDAGGHLESIDGWFKE